jgi:hypothetical protein
MCIGPYLFYQYCSIFNPLDFFFAYSVLIDHMFTLAAAHFIICLWEDVNAREHLGKTPAERTRVMWGYIIHHIMAASAFIVIKYTRQIAAMCLFGLW